MINPSPVQFGDISSQLTDLIENLPASIYWKNREGIYLGRNSYAAERMFLLGYEQSCDKEWIAGKSDFDFFPLEVANHFRINDGKIMQSNNACWYEEENVLPNGQRIKQLSYKKPLYNQYNEITGIIGVTFDFSRVTIKPKNHDLSPRQKSCLFYLAKGETIRGIARILNLSPRTVEHYLEAIKEKLNCYSRTELIARAIELGLI